MNKWDCVCICLFFFVLFCFSVDVCFSTIDTDDESTSGTTIITETPTPGTTPVTSTSPKQDETTKATEPTSTPDLVTPEQEFTTTNPTLAPITDASTTPQSDVTGGTTKGKNQRSPLQQTNPDSKVRGANMGPIWDRQDPDGPMLTPWTLQSGKLLLRLLLQKTRRWWPTLLSCSQTLGAESL